VAATSGRSAHDPPAPLEVGERPVDDEPLKGLLEPAADGGELRFAFLIGEVGERQPEGLEDGRPEIGEREPVVWSSLQSLPDRRPQVNDLHEVVEMAGLEGGVLPVVGEGKQFLVGERISRLAEAVEDRERGDGRGGAAALAAERGELR
jgi:hypothetical protein